MSSSLGAWAGRWLVTLLTATSRSLVVLLFFQKDRKLESTTLIWSIVYLLVWCTCILLTILAGMTCVSRVGS